MREISLIAQLGAICSFTIYAVYQDNGLKVVYETLTLLRTGHVYHTWIDVR